MDDLTPDSWYIVRASYGLPEALRCVAPGLEVTQPTMWVRKFKRRLRVWTNEQIALWPGYAFIRGSFDPMRLSRCSAFHGFVKMDGAPVELPDEVLSLAMRRAEMVSGELKIGSLLEFVEGHILQGLKVNLVKDHGNTLDVHVASQAGSMARMNVGREILVRV